MADYLLVVRERNARARARRMGCRVERVDYEDVVRAANGCCQRCGRELQSVYAAEFDHIVALSAGGPHTRDNVQLLCRPCNLEKPRDERPERPKHQCEWPGCSEERPVAAYCKRHAGQRRYWLTDARRRRRRAALTDEQVTEIRAAAAGGESQREIARRYGVHEATVSRAVRGQTWRGLRVSGRERGDMLEAG